MFTLRFDMRAPSIGAPPSELYAAASEMSAWAETRGCVAAVLCEHHCAEDGYLPSPLLLGAAIASRTNQLLLNLVIILPFYDPARLAEDRTSTSHVILSVDEARERVANGELFNISPLCGGIPPEIAWPYLKRFAELGAGG